VHERYNRDKLLSITSDVIIRFRLPCAQDKNRMRGACRHLADALDRCGGSTLQQRWNHFEKKIWPKWTLQRAEELNDDVAAAIEGVL
jgi:hypothetical protein